MFASALRPSSSPSLPGSRRESAACSVVGVISSSDSKVVPAVVDAVFVSDRVADAAGVCTESDDFCASGSFCLRFFFFFAATLCHAQCMSEASRGEARLGKMQLTAAAALSKLSVSSNSGWRSKALRSAT